MPYPVRDAVGGYNNITDEFFIFSGSNSDGTTNIPQNIGYIYSYKTEIWKPITFNKTQFKLGQHSQYYTQYNNVIYYYVHSSNTINRYNMTYPYSNEYSIPLTDITIDSDPCLSADINGNLFLSSGGVYMIGLNYYGYNINDNIWKTFSDSSYWIQYNYNMRAMSCIVHKQVLYTFGGSRSNMISYHDISDYNKPFLLNEYSTWNKVSQHLNPAGGWSRAVSVNELIYIIGMYSNYPKPDGSCCIGLVNSVQIFDPNTQTIRGPSDGVIPVLNGLHSTTCHFRSTTYTINCFGGAIDITTDKWIYSNPLLTDSPTDSPSNTPTYIPSISPTFIPTNIPSNLPTNLPSQFPSQSPSEIPAKYPTYFPSEFPTEIPTHFPTYLPTNTPSQFPIKLPSKLPSWSPFEIPTKLPTNSPSHDIITTTILQNSTDGLSLTTILILVIVFGVLILFTIIVGFICLIRTIQSKNIKESNSMNTIETQSIVTKDGDNDTSITSFGIIDDDMS